MRGHLHQISGRTKLLELLTRNFGPEFLISAPSVMYDFFEWDHCASGFQRQVSPKSVNLKY